MPLSNNQTTTSEPAKIQGREPVQVQDELKTIATARTRASSELLRDVKRKEMANNLDIEHNAKSIRAILAMNNEIWERCETSTSFKSSSCKLLPCEAAVTRYEYKCVKAFQLRDDHNLKWTVSSKKSEISFDLQSLCILPPKLAFFPPQYLEDENGNAMEILDFEKVVEKAFCFHDDVLGPFLVHLKEHLEKVQVCLGEIDAWLMEHQATTQFLENLFGKAFVEPYELYSQRSCRSYSQAEHCISLEKSMNLCGTVSMCFDLSDKKHRRKLTKFLEFALT